MRPDTIQALVDFVRSRPAQPVEAFERRSNAVIAHDAEDQLIRIKAPAQIAFGRQDVVTCTRCAQQLKNAIRAPSW